MTKKKLKELLDKGDITQEEYDAMLPTAKDDPEPNPGKETEDPAPSPNSDPKPDSKPTEHLDSEEIERRAKTLADKVTAKLGKEKAELQKELDRIKREHMSADERAKADFEQQKQELAQKEQDLQDEKNRMYAVKAMKKAGIDDGDEDIMELVDFVMGPDETTIDSHVKAFKDYADRIVAKQVDQRFKAAGRHPGKGSDTVSPKDNPYTKEGFNLTKQMELETSDPDKAKALKEAASVTTN